MSGQRAEYIDARSTGVHVLGVYRPRPDIVCDLCGGFSEHRVEVVMRHARDRFNAESGEKDAEFEEGFANEILITL